MQTQGKITNESSMRLEETLHALLGASDLTIASSLARNALGSYGELLHASVWGNDADQHRAFLAHEIINEIGIRDFPLLTTTQFGEGIIGQCVEKQEDRLIGSEEFSSAIKVDDRRNFLTSHGVAYVCCLCVPSPPEHPCSVALASKDRRLENAPERLREIKLIIGAFMGVYARISSQKFEQLVQRVSEAKILRSGAEFLKTAGGDIANTFNANTFSVWSIEGDKVVPKYFSEHHKGAIEEYRIGEGLTGNVAKTGKPIFLHVLTDAPSLYGVTWSGKVSDYQSRRPDERDHIMLLPLTYPKSANKPPSVNGLIRFVAEAQNPSFWPIDFKRAQTVAKTLSVLLSQEAVLAEEDVNNHVLKNLLTFAYKSHAAESNDSIADGFLKTIRSWLDVNEVAIIQPDRRRRYDFTQYSWIPSSVTGQLDSKTLDELKHTLRFGETLRILPVRSQETQYAVLAVQLKQNEEYSSEDWIQLASLILGSVFAVRALLDERGRLRRDIEQKEMAALAGAVSRKYAHEVVNGCKAIKAWSALAQKKSPDYHALESRLELMLGNVNELLNSTGFLKLKQRDCVLNQELVRILELCDYRNGANIEDCEIKLDIVGHRHQKVHIDPNTLLGIVQNLIQNAIEQYQLQGKSGPIEIALFEEHVGGSLYAGFHVKDYAVGIPEENLDLIWKEGFTTKDEEGKGIGLSIVKHLVEECGGQVLVATRYGNYASFRVRYPVVTAEP